MKIPSPKITFSAKPSGLVINFINKNDAKSCSLSKTLKQIKFSGQYKKSYLDLSSNQLLIGIELKISNRTADPFCQLQWYELGAEVARALAGTKVDKITLQQTSIRCGADDLQRLVLGIMQASWHYDEYLSAKTAKSKTIEINISPKFSDLKTNEQAGFLQQLEALNSSMLLARTIINEPPETLHPHSAAKLVQETFKGQKNTTVEVHDEAWLQVQGMDGILFVGRGSRYQPRLVHVTLKPNGKVKNRVVLVGKGLTYDSGGLDIKTGGYMKTMKMDMAGSATMFATTKALAELGLKNTELHWLSAFAENMIGPNSYKADDIIRTYSGQTVEVHNTDAEGRLTLADVLSYATTLQPDCIVDAATLTGAAIVALSDRYTALMGNDQKLIDNIIDKFEAEGEYTVYTPMPEVLRESVAGEISDLINTSKIDRQAGHITAGLFLSHFVNQKNFRNPKLKVKKPVDVPWIHLDIAGSAFNDGNNALSAKGATGQSTRSLVNWVKELDS